MNRWSRLVYKRLFLRCPPTMSRYTLLADNPAIEKPVVDDRAYRMFTIDDNQLNVLVITDPTADKAAAALDVNVGLFADHEYRIPGLAHFCEHLLFMGTEKYPEENEYSLYLAKHLGYSNAFTAAEHTNYYFQVGANYLQGALDRFAQFFIGPLFSNSCKDREINAVDSENKKNLQNDLWRLHQLDKLNLNPKHPYNGFSTGNYDTLGAEPKKHGVDVREVLMQFHRDHYLANLMLLVILGKEDLDTLAGWAVDMFAPVANKQLPRPLYNGEVILPPEHLGKLTRVKPVMDTHKLELVFMVPDDLDAKWRLKLLGYYLHLLGHELEGLVLYLLKQKNWVSELSAGNIRICQGSLFFIVEFELTPEGLKNWQEVVVTFFQYLGYLKSLAPQRWIWDEVLNMLKVNFKFKQKSDPLSTVLRLANTMYKYTGEGYVPPEYVLSLLILREFDPELIEEYGSHLRADNFRITFTSQDHTGLNQCEKWYGTEYAYDPIPDELMAKIARCGTNPALHLPAPNDFIPTDFGVLQPKLAQPLAHPYLLDDLSAMQVWFKQDDRFEVPKATIEVLMHLPHANRLLALLTRLQLVADLFNDELNQITYYALLVGLKVAFSFWRDGFSLKVSGYNDKLPVLFAQVVEKLVAFVPSPDRFDAIKFKMAQELKNFGFHVPYNQIGTHHMLLVNEHTYTYPAKLRELENMTYDDVARFVRDDLWAGGVFSELLIHGNFDVAHARDIKDTYAEKLGRQRTVEGLPALIRLRNAVLAPGTLARYQLALDDDKEVNLCLEYYVQVLGDRSDERLRVLTDLLGIVMREPCFNQLRTKEQLGYVVFWGIRVLRTLFGFRVLVQLERTTDYLEYRIDEFLAQMGRWVALEMDDATFAKYKQALKDMKLTKLKHLSEETARYWSAITDGYYNFDARTRHVEVLDTITKLEFLKFYLDYVLNKLGKLAKLTVHLTAQQPPAVPHDKLVYLLVINWVFRNDHDVDLDKIDDILKQTTELDEVAARVTQLTGGDAKDLRAALDRDLATPVPAGYPSGTLYLSIDEFRATHPMGDRAVPVEPLRKFYYPDPSHL